MLVRASGGGCRGRRMPFVKSDRALFCGCAALPNGIVDAADKNSDADEIHATA